MSEALPSHPSSKPVAVIDLGSQFTDRILILLRAQWFEWEIVKTDISLSELEAKYGAVILSGGWDSVYQEWAPTIQSEIIFSDTFPVLGLCYGMQLIAYIAGWTVSPGEREEWVLEVNFDPTSSPVFDGLTSPQMIQLTHGDQVSAWNPGEWFEVMATSVHDIVSAIQSRSGKIVGFQWHLEVHATPNGGQMIHNFLTKNAGLTPGTPETISELKDRLITEIREQVWDKQVLTFVSGWVDSTVCLALLKEALRPEQIFPVFIDNGFMRAGEVERVQRELYEATGIPIRVIEAEEDFLSATTIYQGQQTPPLREVTDPEMKRAIIGDAFVAVRNSIAEEGALRADFLLGMWTLSTDVKESGAAGAGWAAKKIKLHHNRTDAVEKLMAEWRVIEPLVELLKDGVRELGRELGLQSHMVQRNPFPGPGIAIRIICADKSETEEFERLTPLVQEIIPPEIEGTLLPIKAVWVAGDERVYGNIVALSGDGDPNWEQLMHIREELTRIHGICRVVYAFGGNINATEIHEITPTFLSHETADQVRHADEIVHEEFGKAGLLGYISQAPVASIPVGFETAWNRSIIIRPFKSPDFKTWEAIMPGNEHMPDAVLERIVERILAEVPEISRVLYDLTPKPPGTTEFE